MFGQRDEGQQRKANRERHEEGLWPLAERLKDELGVMLGDDRSDKKSSAVSPRPVRTARVRVIAKGIPTQGRDRSRGPKGTIRPKTDPWVARCKRHDGGPD